MRLLQAIARWFRTAPQPYVDYAAWHDLRMAAWRAEFIAGVRRDAMNYPDPIRRIMLDAADKMSG